MHITYSADCYGIPLTPISFLNITNKIDLEIAE